jgi:hypothetical protein
MSALMKEGRVKPALYSSSRDHMAGGAALFDAGDDLAQHRDQHDLWLVSTAIISFTAI